MASQDLAEPDFNQLVSTFLQHAVPGPNANPARLKDDFVRANIPFQSNG